MVRVPRDSRAESSSNPNHRQSPEIISYHPRYSLFETPFDSFITPNSRSIRYINKFLTNHLISISIQMIYTFSEIVIKYYKLVSINVDEGKLSHLMEYY